MAWLKCDNGGGSKEPITISHVDLYSNTVYNQNIGATFEIHCKNYNNLYIEKVMLPTNDCYVRIEAYTGDESFLVADITRIITDGVNYNISSYDKILIRARATLDVAWSGTLYLDNMILSV